jgi:hypothetical protein
VVLFEAQASFRTNRECPTLQPVLTPEAAIPRVSVASHGSAGGLHHAAARKAGGRLKVLQMNPACISANAPAGAAPTIKSFSASPSSGSAGSSLTLASNVSSVSYQIVSPAIGALRGTVRRRIRRPPLSFTIRNRAGRNSSCDSIQ